MNVRSDALDKLRHALEQLTRDACDLMTRKDRLFAMVPRPWLRVRTGGGGSFSVETDVRHQPVLMSVAERDLSALQTADAAYQALWDLPARSQLVPPLDSRSPDFDEVAYLREMYVVGFLKRYFAGVKGSAYEPSAFADAFASLADVVTYLSMEERALIPLSGLSWEADRDAVDLGSGVRLRLLTDDDRERMLNTGRDPVLGARGLEGNVFLWAQACLEASWRMSLHLPHLSPERFDAIYDAVTALRIAAAGMISASACHATSSFIGWYGVGHVYRPLHYGANTPAGPYVLSDERLVRVQEVFRALRGLSPTDRRDVQLSVDRFHRSFDVRAQEERVVDLMIVLDSLLGTKGPGAVHSLSIRLPLYVSNDKEERLAMSQLVRKAYAMRSAIVHGGRMSARPPGDVAAFLQEVEEAIRRAIRRAILEAAAGTRRIADIPGFIDEDLILGITSGSRS